MTVQRVTVTAKQRERIEAAWSICAYGNGRKAIEGWAKAFRDCVAEVLGYEPPAAFTLVVSDEAQHAAEAAAA